MKRGLKFEMSVSEEDPEEEEEEDFITHIVSYLYMKKRRGKNFKMHDYIVWVNRFKLNICAVAKVAQAFELATALKSMYFIK